MKQNFNFLQCSGYIYSAVCLSNIFYIVLGDQLSPLVIISYPKYKLCLLWMSDNALWLDAVASSLWSLQLKNAARFQILSRVNTVGALDYSFTYDIFLKEWTGKMKF